MTPEEIIDRWHTPLFVATIDNVFKRGELYTIGSAQNPVCGDSCTMFAKLQLVAESGLLKVIDARHITRGCTIITAAADILCEKMIGQRPDFEINLFEILEIPIGRNRRQCVLTPIQAFKEALQ